MRRYLIIAVLLTAAVIAALLIYSTTYHPDMTAGWGRGRIAVSERYYCKNTFNRIVRAWRDEAWEIDTGPSGLLKPPYNSYLVIDTWDDKIYLEQNGEVFPGNTIYLPKNMKWRFYRNTPAATTDLPPLVRLKMRGEYTRKEYPEIICLTGHSRGPEHITFTIRSGDGDFDCRTGPHTTVNYTPLSKNAKPFYSSMLVTEDEYYASIDPNRPISGSNENYSEVEPGIYQQIEARLNSIDLRLRTLKVAPGRDGTAAWARAEVERERQSFLRRYLTRSRAWVPITDRLIFKMNRIDDNLWYVKTAPYSKRDPREETVSFDFIVTSGKPMKSALYDEQLAKARKQYGKIEIPTSKHKASLPNGVTIELIGACAYPSIGRQWWAPDGQPIAAEPTYFSNHIDYDTVYRIQSEKQLELAWRINFPPNTINSSVRYSSDAGSGSAGRGGSHAASRIRVQRFSVDETAETFNITFSISINTGPLQSATFKNISLTPNKNQRFEINLQK